MLLKELKDSRELKFPNFRNVTEFKRGMVENSIESYWRDKDIKVRLSFCPDYWTSKHIMIIHYISLLKYDHQTWFITFN